MYKCKVLVCLWIGAVAFSSLGYAAAAPDRIQGVLTGGPAVALAGGVHRKALPQYDRGPADPGLQFASVTLLTTPTAAQQKALTQLLAEQQDPKSANYHKWLTPEQWAARFGLNQHDIQQMTGWLQAQGFTITAVARGRNWITFSGNARQIQNAFGTEIHRFEVNGEMHVANATAPKIPAGLAGIVTGIRGLDDFHLRPRSRVRPNYFDSNFGVQFVAPGDIATIYDISPLYSASTPIDGTGQKLAVIGQTDIYLGDITDFRAGFGLSSISCTTNSNKVITACSDPHLKYVVPAGLSDPGVPLTGGDLSEADLDLEWAGAVARGAQLIYVNAPTNGSGGSGGGVWSAWYWAVDQDLAPVITLSYGVCEFGDTNVLTSTGAAAGDEIELQMANSEGITFVNSSGDSGAAECDPTFGGMTPPDTNGASATQGLALGYPASSPEVTGVGGTATPLADFSSPYWGTSNSVPDLGSALEYVPEQAWNDDEELAQYCQQNSGNQFCTQGGSSPVTGWQPITSTTANAAKVMQEDLALVASGISSTGGGVSNCAVQNSGFTACVSGFPQPSWQAVTVSGQTAARYSPDVSFLASPNFPGYIFCTELSELGVSGGGRSCQSGIATAIDSYTSIIGGTSAAAPLFAGMVTLLNQYLGQSGLGNVNPNLYQIAATPSNGAFNQPVSGDNNVYCTVGDPNFQPTALRCPSAGVFGFSVNTTGYNLATGLGSVDMNKLALAWNGSGTQGNFSLAASAGLSAIAGQSSNSTTITITPQNSFTGTVSFSCSGLLTGQSCSFNPTTVSGGSGTTQLTVTGTPANVAAQNVTVTVKGTSGTVSATTTVSLAISKTNETFTLGSSSAGGTVTVAQGQTSGAVNMTVASTTGFVVTSGTSSTTALPVTYTCAGLPSEATCIFSPGGTGSGTTSSTSVSLTISTTAPTSKLLRPFDRETKIFYAMLLPGLFGIFFTFGSSRRAFSKSSQSIVRVLGLILVLGVSTVWMASCGGSSSSSTVKNLGTPIGSSNITINATTGGAAPITASMKFTLSVIQ